MENNIRNNMHKIILNYKILNNLRILPNILGLNKKKYPFDEFTF
jgi:hypothetical protein